MQKAGKQWKVAVVIISMCVAALISSGMPGASVKAADSTETKTYEDFQYTVLADNTIKIAKYAGHGKNIVVPETIEGKKVTVIGKEAFSQLGFGYLTSITIPDGVTQIEEFAFHSCGITSMTIPDSVTQIGQYAFSYCNDLTMIELPSGATNIGKGVFKGCSGLTMIELPSGLTDIGTFAFQDCSSLTTIELPSGVTNIGEGVFQGCSGLTTIELPSGLTDIGTFAFQNCSSLTTIELPAGLTKVGQAAFSGCSGLTTIELPSKVTDIGTDVFRDCSSLTTIELPSGVTDIGNNTFSGCSGLTDITIPDSVTDIGFSAFEGCESLTAITIPDSVISIRANAFERCKSLTAITIPDGVTTIGFGAFEDCKNLARIEIPSSVTDIGSGASFDFGIVVDPFNVCPSETVIYTDAGSYAETWANGVGYTVVNAAMPEDGSSMQLAEGTNITVGALKCELMVLPYDGETPKVTYVKSKDTKSDTITVPDTVTVDGITYKVAGIADSAFSDCTSVKEVVLPASLETVDKAAFDNMADSGEETEKKLNVKIPEDMENIETLGLENITNITNIIFYVAAGSNAQIYLNQYENVSVNVYQSEGKPDTEDDPGEKQEPSKEDLKQPDTGEKQDQPAEEPQRPQKNKTYTVKGLRYKVTSSKTVSFTGAGKKTMKKLTIPSKVTILGQSFQVTSVGKRACKKYKKLETVVIGANVKTIGDEAFRDCSKLKKITVGKNVTTIGKKVFYRDKKLVRIILKGAKIKKIGKKALYKVPTKAKITAPRKAKKKYKRLLNAAK